MKFNQKILLIVLGIILIAGGAVTYYFLNKNSLNTDDWKSYDGVNESIDFTYPSSWFLTSDTSEEIAFFLNGKDSKDGLFTIQINNQYSELSSICKYCFAYKATAKNGGITLNSEDKFQQDVINYVPQSKKAKGYESKTDRFSYKSGNLQITLVTYSEATKRDSDASNTLFKKVVSTIRLK